MQVRRIVILSGLMCVLSACGGSRGTGVIAPPASSQQVAGPIFSLASGTYDSAENVTISSTPGATVYYTTDGRTPTSLSRVYTGPLSVTTSIELKAIAVDGNSDAVSTAAYIIKSGDASLSGLPIPPGSGVPRPDGKTGGLRVLDWAGFNAAVTYTFDDSYQSQISAYPQLQDTGVRMTFYLIGYGDHNSPVWAQAAQDGHEIGNHTEHHCTAKGDLCGGNWTGNNETEYDQCTDHIKRRYGIGNVWTTASPYGDRGYDSVAATRFLLNRGVQEGQIGMSGYTDVYNLPVHSPKAGETSSTFNSFIDLARSSGKWQIFMFHSLQPGSGIAPVDVTDVIASIDHAKSTGDIWIDSMVNVGAYWLGDRIVTTESSRGGDTEQLSGENVISWTLPAHFPTGRYVRVTVTGGILKQNGQVLPWNDAGFYEVALDPGSLTISPR
jgi:peptidoglycan/xylan/chitin deacetylase (PgdA/CDA1 family)